MKKIVTLLTLVLCALTSFAHDVPKDDTNLKYFVVQGKPKPEIMKILVDNPADPWPGAEKLVSSIEGAKLIDYYLMAGSAQNLAIIAVPDSKYAAAIVYQRMGSLMLDDMVVFEVIPSRHVKEVLEISKELNKSDVHQKK